MNQRRRTRVQARKAVTLSGSGIKVEGEIVNVSLKGCLVGIQAEQRPAEDDVISVTIHLEPGAENLDVTVRGRVVRQYPEGVALEFTEVPPESFNHLFRLVQYNAPDPEGIEKELSSSAFGPADLAKH